MLNPELAQRFTAAGGDIEAGFTNESKRHVFIEGLDPVPFGHFAKEATQTAITVLANVGPSMRTDARIRNRIFTLAQQVNGPSAGTEPPKTNPKPVEAKLFQVIESPQGVRIHRKGKSTKNLPVMSFFDMYTRIMGGGKSWGEKGAPIAAKKNIEWLLKELHQYDNVDNAHEQKEQERILEARRAWDEQKPSMLRTLREFLRRK